MNRIPLPCLVVLLMQLASSAYAQTVKLAWDSNAESTLAGYRVYRSEESGVFSSKPINGSTLVTSTSWTDSTVKNNRTYYYIVRAVDKSAVESTNSNQVTVTVRANQISAADMAPASDLQANVVSFSSA